MTGQFKLFSFSIISVFFINSSIVAAPSHLGEDAKKSRERTIIHEKKVKFKKGERTTLNFDAANISGEVKMPLGSRVESIQSDKSYDFVRVRTRWTPEMAQSASTLETGRSIR